MRALAPNDRIAGAGNGFQPRPVPNDHHAVAILDHPGALEAAGDGIDRVLEAKRDARPPVFEPRALRSADLAEKMIRRRPMRRPTGGSGPNDPGSHDVLHCLARNSDAIQLRVERDPLLCMAWRRNHSRGTAIGK
jgi:hypothetical protein